MKRFSHVSVLVFLLLLLVGPTVTAAPLTWQQMDSLPANPDTWTYRGLTYSNDQFVVLEIGALHTSPFGQGWTTGTTTGMVWSPIKFLNGWFIGGGNSGNGKYITASDDGVSWDVVVDLGTNTTVRGIAYGNGRFLVASQYQVNVLSSDLRQLGRSRPGSGIHPLGPLAYGKGVFVGTSGGLYYTTDGQTWTEALPPLGEYDSGTGFRGLAYGNGRFVAAGQIEEEQGRYTAMLYISTDGKQWQRVSIDAAPIGGVLFGGGQFLAWGEESVFTSTDGEHWTASTNPNGATLFTYGAGRFMAIGSDRTVMTATVCGSRFPDVAAGEPNCDAIEALAGRQTIGGYPNGTFQPDAPVTRAEMVKMLVLTLGLQPEPQAAISFTDAADHWATQGGYLQTAIGAGIVNGYPDGTFRPDQPVTRAEAVKLIAAAAGLSPESGTAYADTRDGDWFTGWVIAARNKGLIGAGGYHALWVTDQFQGTAATGRGETATLLDNLYNR